MKDAAKIAAELAGNPAVESDVLRQIIADKDREMGAIMLKTERWRMWIVERGRTHRDHACAECFPDGDSLVKGFRCVFHECLKPKS